MVRITVLVDNITMRARVLAEHGLAFWIEIDDHKILFDSGQGYVILNNAEELNIPLHLTQAVILSHGHYDHVGGLAKVLSLASPDVYAHPAAFKPKFARNPDGTSREIGAAPNILKELQKRKIIETTGAATICNRLHVTGQVPRINSFEDDSGTFFLDAELSQADTLPDDQAVFVDTSDGTVVLLGCTHSGVINTLQYVRELTGGRPIHTVIGGMHLLNASPERIAWTIEAISQLNVKRLIPAHCTGLKTAVSLCSSFPDSCEICRVGTTLTFE